MRHPAFSIYRSLLSTRRVPRFDLILVIGVSLLLASCSSPIPSIIPQSPSISAVYNSSSTPAQIVVTATVATGTIKIVLRDSIDITSLGHVSAFGNSFYLSFTPEQGRVYFFTVVDSGNRTASTSVKAPYLSVNGMLSLSASSIQYNTTGSARVSGSITVISGGFEYADWYVAAPAAAAPGSYLVRTYPGQTASIPVTWEGNGTVTVALSNDLGTLLQTLTEPLTGQNSPPSTPMLTFWDGTQWLSAGASPGAMTVVQGSLVRLRLALSDPNGDICEAMVYNSGTSSWSPFFSQPGTWGTTFLAPISTTPVTPSDIYVQRDPDGTGNSDLYEVQFLASATAGPYVFQFQSQEQSTLDSYSSNYYNLTLTVSP